MKKLLKAIDRKRAQNEEATTLDPSLKQLDSSVQAAIEAATVARLA